VRIAVISDIHGNRVALDAVLDDLLLNPYDRLVCLGDAVQGGAQPAAVVARLRELDCPVVMGNADAWLLYGDAADIREPTTDRQRAIREWSLTQLSAKDLDFMKSFQPRVEIPLSDERSLLSFHGSPSSYDDLIFPETPEDEVRVMLGNWPHCFLTGGHTHLQQIRRLDDTLFFNPGSVGVAYNRHQPEEGFKFDPWAEYAIFDLHHTSVHLEFRRTPFDIAALIEITVASGQPDSERLREMY
jgi:predicted phosphodiesterase